MPSIKAVIDTNILISCLLKSPVNLAIYEAFRGGKFQLVASERLIEELKEVFMGKDLGIELALFHELITTIRLKAIMVKPKISLNICRDAEDNFILEIAREAKATHIITRDKDILELKPLFKDIAILSPAEFLRII